MNIETNSAADTIALAAEISRIVEPGDVICLVGDLGAGKTQFVKGLAEGIGYTGKVVSPTFCLVREYHGGRVDMFHLDLYRLGRLQEVIDLDLAGMLASKGLVAIEWGSGAREVIGDNYLEVSIELGPQINERVILLTPQGNWGTRLEGLR